MKRYRLNVVRDERHVILLYFMSPSHPNPPPGSNPQLVLEAAWRIPKWPMMKDALTQVEISCPKELVWKVNLYRGYIAICHSEDPHLMTMIDKLVEVASNQVC